MEELPFANLSFVLIQSKKLTSKHIGEITGLISDHGGSRENVNVQDGNGKIHGHPRLIVISETTDFKSYTKLIEQLVMVVRPQWLKDVIAHKKFMPACGYSPDTKNAFRNLFITCSDMSEADKEILYSSIGALGGMTSDVLTTLTTHVIASECASEKCSKALTHRIKIVLPSWVDHCIKLGRLLDDGPYLLPDPLILRRYAEAADHDESIDDFALRTFHTLRFPETGNLLKGKSFFIGSDLISQKAINLIPSLIALHSGELVDYIDDAIIYIGRMRSGDEYLRACERNMIIGSVEWLCEVVHQRRWFEPIHLLHIPRSPTPIPGFQNLTICLTNYLGDTRTYLEKLVTAAGAKLTKVLREDVNTHLIAAFPSGPKYEYARKWNIKIVSHLWLEESYKNWEKLNESGFLDIPSSLDSIPAVLSVVYPKRDYATVPVKSLTPRHPERSAKSKAAETLKIQSALEFEYLKQYKRAKHTKRQELPALETESQDDRKPKKLKVSSPSNQVTQEPEISFTFVTTGLEGETNERLLTHKKQLENIGLVQVSDVKLANYLVAPNVLRTSKFLRSMARVEEIVAPFYLLDCLEANDKLPLDSKYLLRYKHDILANFLGRLKGQLFSGLSFNFVADSNLMPFHEIVRDHGGEAHLVRSSNKRTKTNDYRECRDGTILLISTSRNNKQVDLFKQQVPAGKGIALSKDFIASAILNSEYDLAESEYIL